MSNFHDTSARISRKQDGSLTHTYDSSYGQVKGSIHNGATCSRAQHSANRRTPNTTWDFNRYQRVATLEGMSDGDDCVRQLDNSK